MQDINEIDDLIKIIAKLPGLGPVSAKRIVLKLINNKEELVKPMANSLAQVYKNVTRCNLCGSLKSNIKVVLIVQTLKKNLIKFVLMRIYQINGLLKILIFLKGIIIFWVGLLPQRVIERKIF